MNPKTYAQLARDVVSKLRDFGLRISQNSRFAAYERMFTRQEQSGRTVMPGDSDFPGYIEGVKDLVLFDFILSKLCGHPDDQYGARLPRREILLRKFQRAIGDTPYDAAKKVPSARDVQWELYVASISVNSGSLPVVLLEEDPTRKTPDLEITIEGTRYSVEAKRITSSKRRGIKDQLKSAFSQIESGKYSGFIALDISISVNPRNMNFVARFDNDRAAEARWNDFTKAAHLGLISSAVARHPRVMAVIVCETQKWQLVDGSFAPRGTWGYVPNSRYMGQLPHVVERLIHGRWMSGIPNRQMRDESDPQHRRGFDV